jgi:predicted ATPase
MAALHTIRLGGWKSIREMEPLEIRPINVVIGPNGSGKSNLIQFFKLLNELVGERLQVFLETQGGAESVLHFGAKVTQAMEAELVFDTENGQSTYSFRLRHAPVERLIFDEEVLQFHRPNHAEPYREVLGAGYRESLLRPEAERGNQTARVIRSLLARCRVFHFHDTSSTAHIRQSTYINRNLHLEPDAGNVAAMLYLYRERHPVVYRRIVSTIRKLCPSFGDFVLEPKRLYPEHIDLNWRHSDRDYLFGPHQFSDGTLRAVALTTLLLQPEEDLPDLIVIDEPELGLHPSAIEMIAGLVRAVSNRTRVILATQSRTFVDHFLPEEVLVTETDAGGSRFRRLAASDLQDWLDQYSVGELWEKNVIGGGPLP